MNSDPQAHRRHRAWMLMLVAGAALAAASGVEGRIRTDMTRASGNGLLGLRAVAANLAWIATQAAWERRDPVATVAGVRRAVALDPDRLTFWINGARMIAYDLPAWSVAAEVDRAGTSLGPLREARPAYAQQALAHLVSAQRVHPGRSALWIERGNIELWARGNLVGAARAFGRAAELPDAPGYALRVEIALWRRLGRHGEALERLSRWESNPGRVDREEARAQRLWVTEMIREITKELEAAPR